MPFQRKTAKTKAPMGEAELYSYALKALGRQMRTEVELRRLMTTRAEPGERGEAAVSVVIAQLKEKHYLDDQSFAETYARLRQENEKLGARRVRQALQQKGIRRELVNEAVDARYGYTNEERLAREEKLAREHLERKRIRKPENEKDTARVMRRLVAAGFSTGTIYKVLRRWDVPEEGLAALEALDADGDAAPSEE
ncbi:MAG TPA: regulatory protein RecX [Terracidiphilus sp.]|jgi:regulatory protein